MSKDIKTAAIGGNGPANNVHFHEDALFESQALPTSTATVYGEVCDLGETLAGLTIRAIVDEDLADTASATLTIGIYAGDNAAAAPTDATAWKKVYEYKATGTAFGNAGDCLFAYTPAPGEGKKYCFGAVSITGSGTTSGKFSVWNELSR